MLVVDLDGTLLRTDMLYETFCAAVARDWRNVFLALPALTRGPAELKRFLADAATLDVATLPYDEAVLTLVNDHRKSGGRTALVSAAHHDLVTAIAGHLGVFDEAFGSDGKTNLKGRAKGAFLEERYGYEGFTYVGDSSADLEVWNRASSIVTANASPRVRLRAEQLERPVRHLPTEARPALEYLRALRPHQWLKNLLVFIPLLAGHRLDLPTLGESLVAYISFCLVASSVYVMNDLVDLPSDRDHPRKRFRAFASGRVPLAHGLVMLPALLLAGFSLAMLAGWPFVLIMIVYFTLTTGYSLVLKRHMVIDICTLAILYTTRIVAGALATGISLSVWLLAFSLFFFFALAALKRQVELVDIASRDGMNARGRGYHVDDLAILSPTVLASGYVSVLVLALYVASDDVTLLYSQPAALWGVCVILFYWITRVALLANRGCIDDDPIVFALSDRASHLCLAGILAFAIAGALV